MSPSLRDRWLAKKKKGKSWEKRTHIILRGVGQILNYGLKSTTTELLIDKFPKTSTYIGELHHIICDLKVYWFRISPFNQVLLEVQIGVLLSY